MLTIERKLYSKIGSNVFNIKAITVIFQLVSMFSREQLTPLSTHHSYPFPSFFVLHFHLIQIDYDQHIYFI
jgi:hypothetical protein